MKEITDPNLLKELNAKEVTDPGILAQLEGANWQPPSAEEEAIREPSLFKEGEAIPSLLDPGQAFAGAATGAVTAMRMGKPIFKEAADWMAWGLPSLVKSVKSGAESLVRGLAAKNLEKTIPVEKAASQAFSESSGKWLPMAAQATTKEMQGLIDLAKREKVSILAPDITGSRSQAIIFNAADKAIGGAGVTQKVAAKVVQDMDAYSNRLLGTLGGKADPTVMGETARAGMKFKFDAVEEFGSQLYDMAARESAGVETSLTNAAKTINEIKNSKEWLYLSGEVKSVLSKVFDDIAPSTATKYGELPPELIARLEKQGDLINKMDFTEVEAIRKAVSKLTFHTEISGDYGNRISGQVLSALEKDMESASKEAGTVAYEAYKAARNYQKQYIFGKFKGKTELGTPSIGSRIQKVADEDFLKIISKGNITELEELKRVLPGYTMQEVKRAWLTNIFSKYSRDLNTPQLSGQFINAPRVAKELDNYGEKYLKTLFNDHEYKMIEEFKNVASHEDLPKK
jgi:hypothetical protein